MTRSQVEVDKLKATAKDQDGVPEFVSYENAAAESKATGLPMLADDFWDTAIMVPARSIVI